MDSATTSEKIERDLVVLHRSATIIEAFRSENEQSDGLLRLAGHLASQHQRQWDAETISRDTTAADATVAASKRTIDSLNTARVTVVEQIDDYVASCSTAPDDAPLHTETVGSVIDRLAIAWVRANKLIDAGAKDRARQALHQLRELAAAYDDLVRDVTGGARRVPAWRHLKQYQAAS
ncbi:DUF4254 domain-containing protein [Promicromonospora sukumoe]|uniref:DUF4254 domain-containing protein n=1 Tax=Promicromonospora sukumoe TaxID=88382 RepID=UPI00037BC0BF|nr:DUF4254 domain-containing protein [Promicromonospora sukumoe]